MESLIVLVVCVIVSVVALLVAFFLAACNVSGRCSENERLIMEDWDDEEE